MDGIIVWSPGTTLDSIEKQVILAAFKFFKGNKTATANSLGIAIRTLDNKFERYENDDKLEKERQENESRKRTEFLARQRGANTPNYTGDTTPTGPSPVAGVRVEPSQKTTAQLTMPMSKRAEVQGVLPTKIASPVIPEKLDKLYREQMGKPGLIFRTPENDHLFKKEEEKSDAEPKENNGAQADQGKPV